MTKKWKYNTNIDSKAEKILHAESGAFVGVVHNNPFVSVVAEVVESDELQDLLDGL